MSRQPKYKTNQEIEVQGLPKERVSQLEKLIKNRPDKLIKVSDICPNFWNHNVMGSQFLSALEEALSNDKFGQIAPIIACNNFSGNPMGTEPYCIIDGYHRWLIHVKKGISHIRAIILPDISEDEAKMITLMMNRIRGNTPDINIYEAIQAINAHNINADIYRIINIEKIEFNKYDPPPATIAAPPASILESKPIVTGQQMVDASVMPQKETDSLQNFLEEENKVVTEEIKATMSQVRTMPITIFVPKERYDETNELISKGMAREGLSSDINVGKGLIVMKALKVYHDTEERKKLIDRQDKNLAKLSEKEAEKEQKAAIRAEQKKVRDAEKLLRKQEAARKNAEKRAEKKQKKEDSSNSDDNDL